ncbi:hypothetical protein ACFFWB_26985 [Flavobacterium procerum]|uniref:hypothetical protein n=1 Tax=Flavobacterium procerum TaxID=1455569 RepID=UPI0035E6C1A6
MIIIMYIENHFNASADGKIPKRTSAEKRSLPKNDNKENQLLEKVKQKYSTVI